MAYTESRRAITPWHRQTLTTAHVGIPRSFTCAFPEQEVLVAAKTSSVDARATFHPRRRPNRTHRTIREPPPFQLVRKTLDLDAGDTVRQCEPRRRWGALLGIELDSHRDIHRSHPPIVHYFRLAAFEVAHDIGNLRVTSSLSPAHAVAGRRAGAVEWVTARIPRWTHDGAAEHQWRRRRSWTSLKRITHSFGYAGNHHTGWTRTPLIDTGTCARRCITEGDVHHEQKVSYMN